MLQKRYSDNTLEQPKLQWNLTDGTGYSKYKDNIKIVTIGNQL